MCAVSTVKFGLLFQNNILLCYRHGQQTHFVASIDLAYHWNPAIGLNSAIMTREIMIERTSTFDTTLSYPDWHCPKLCIQEGTYFFLFKSSLISKVDQQFIQFRSMLEEQNEISSQPRAITTKACHRTIITWLKPCFLLQQKEKNSGTICQVYQK